MEDFTVGFERGINVEREVEDAAVEGSLNGLIEEVGNLTRIVALLDGTRLGTVKIYKLTDNAFMSKIVTRVSEFTYLSACLLFNFIMSKRAFGKQLP